jgi:hypothetical protein
MKRKILLIALTLSLNIFTFNSAKAEKPIYCEAALNSCLARCDQILGWPLNEACRVGCWIAYQNCGIN